LSSVPFVPNWCIFNNTAKFLFKFIAVVLPLLWSNVCCLDNAMETDLPQGNKTFWQKLVRRKENRLFHCRSFQEAGFAVGAVVIPYLRQATQDRIPECTTISGIIKAGDQGHLACGTLNDLAEVDY
jgi:hypothetical protein